jgi:hypothetical protein
MGRLRAGERFQHNGDVQRYDRESRPRRIDGLRGQHSERVGHQCAVRTSVTGTNTGIDVNNNNIINNFGTVTTSGGDLYAISGNGSLTVNNSGSIGNTNEFPGVNSFGVGLTVNNNAGAVIYGQSAAIQGAGILGVGTTTVVNSGLINGQFTGIDGGSGFLDITNMLSKYSSATEPVADPSAALTLNTLSSLTLRRRQTKFSGSGSNVWTRSNSALRRLA